MSYRYANNQDERAFRAKMLKFRKGFNQTANHTDRFSFYFTSGFDHERLPVITQQNPDDITWMTWGLIPHSVRGTKAKEEYWATSSTGSLNIRSGSLEDSTITKEIIKTNRCLIPATGFFEIYRAGDLKYPYFIEVNDMDICFAGIYETWTDCDSGEIINCFAILTAKAWTHNIMEQVINKLDARMPCILPDDQFYEWLDPTASPAKVERLLYDFDDGIMQAYTVNRNVLEYGKNHDGPEALQFYPYKILGDGGRINMY